MADCSEAAGHTRLNEDPRPELVLRLHHHLGGRRRLLNLTVGLEVAGGFAILASEFLDQTAIIRERQR